MEWCKCDIAQPKGGDCGHVLTEHYHLKSGGVGVLEAKKCIYAKFLIK